MRIGVSLEIVVRLFLYLFADLSFPPAFQYNEAKEVEVCL